MQAKSTSCGIRDSMLAEGYKPHKSSDLGVCVCVCFYRSILCHGTFTGNLNKLVVLTTEYVFLFADKLKESV